MTTLDITRDDAIEAIRREVQNIGQISNEELEKILVAILGDKMDANFSVVKEYESTPDQFYQRFDKCYNWYEERKSTTPPLKRRGLKSKKLTTSQSLS